MLERSNLFLHGVPYVHLRIKRRSVGVKKEVTLIAERFTESSVTYWLSKAKPLISKKMKFLEFSVTNNNDKKSLKLRILT